MLTAKRSLAPVLVVIAWGVAACTDPVATPSGRSLDLRYGKASTTGVSVKATSPSSAPQNVTLDVQISGSGFDPGSSAQWLLNGSPDPRVKTNSTQFVSSSSLIANLTISADAVPTFYDVSVITSSGKKGIGTEAFAVLPMVELSAPAGVSRANDINTSGLIVGNRSGGCNSAVLPVVWAADGSIADLPLPAPFCNAAAVRIDEAGDIVGTAGPSPSQTIVRWTPGTNGYTAQIIGTLSGSVEVDGMNAAGHFVGSFLNGSVRTSFWWSPETGFLTLANPAGMTSCYVGDVNDSDQIIGSCHASGNMQAIFWGSPSSAGEFLPALSGYTSSYSGNTLNNPGIAAGYAGTSIRGQVVYTAVRWVRTGTTWTVGSIGTLGGNHPVPNAMNDAGWITGSDISSGGTRHAFVWIPATGMKDLGVNGTESYAWGINNPSDPAAIRIVGMSNRQGNFRAVIWRPQ